MAVANLVLKVTGQMAEAQKDLEKTSALLGDFGKQFQTTSTKAQKAMADLNAAFSGEKIISQAAQIVTAVEKIGGASKLTGAEQEKVNRIVSEAISKYGVLGQQAPAAMTALADATKRAEQEIAKIPPQTSNVLGSLKSIAGAVGIGFSIGAIVSFGKSVFDSASKIHDLAEEMQISTDAVQGFKFAAEQSGSSLDAVARATVALTDNLAKGDKSTVNALKDMHLQFSDIRKLKIEDAFLAVTDAAKDMPDPIKQTSAVLALLGGKSKELLPGIREGFRDAANGAAKMSKDTIDSLEAAQDAWGKLVDKVTIATGTLIAKQLAVSTSIKALRDDEDALYRSLISQNRLAEAQALLDAAAKRFAAARDIYMGGGGPGKPTLTADQLAEIERHTKAIRDLAAELTHTDLTRKAKDLAEALGSIGTKRRTPELLKEVADRAADLFLKGGKLSGELFELALRMNGLNLKVAEGVDGLGTLGLKLDLAAPKASALAAATDDLAGKIKIGADGASNLGTKIGTGFEEAAKKIEEANKRAKREIDDLIRSIDRFASLSGSGLFGTVAQDIATIADAWLQAARAVEAYGEATTLAGKAAAVLSGVSAVAQSTGSGSTKSRVIGGAVAGFAVAGVYGAAAGAIIGWIRGNNAVAKAAKDAASQFMALQTQVLHTYGGMARLEVLANEVGLSFRNAFSDRTAAGADRLSALVDQLEERQSKLNAAMEEYGFTWEDLGDKARAAKLGDLFTTLLEKTDLLKGAGIDYHEILLRQSADYSNLVQAAIRTGTEIPIALKQTLQDLVDMGTLVDENGQSFTDLSKVTWAKTLTQGFDEVTDAIKALTRALVGDLGGALDDLGRRQIHIPVSIDVTEGPEKIPHFGTGAIVRRPTLAMVGKSGPEAIVPLSGNQLGLSGGISITVVSELDGRVVARNQVRHIPGVVETLFGR